MSFPLYECETWSQTVCEFGQLANRVQRRIFVPKKQEVKGGLRIKMGNLTLCTACKYQNDLTKDKIGWTCGTNEREERYMQDFSKKI